MPAVMRILGWKTQGLRCPDHEVDCCDSTGKPYRVTLIQMPNGTGKTTTLSLLRAALSGTAGAWGPEQVKQFQKRGDENSNGYFEVRLLLNDRRVTIIMNFDFESGRVYYKTTRSEGQVDGFKPPADFHRFLNENFVNFFVFDGELAQHLLKEEYTDAESVLENLFQIKLLHDLEEKVEGYWATQTANVTATEEKGLTRRRNNLKQLKDQLQSSKDEKRLLEDRRVRIVADLQRYQQKYDQEISKEKALSERLKETEMTVNILEDKVRDQALDILDMMRDPHAISYRFAEAMYELKMGLDRVKLPESVAREFFEELAEETECVCGRPIDAGTRDVIRSRAAKYLGSNDVSLLNSMKASIQDAVGASRDEPEKVLNQKLAELKDTVQEERNARQELDELRAEADQADPAIKAAREEIERLEAQLSHVDQRLEKVERDIDVFTKQAEEAERKYAEITHTIDLKHKRDVLIEIIKDAYVRAQSGITTEICEETNRRITQLMPFNKVSVARIEHSLVLADRKGASEGETLSVAYAFLATLFHRAEHQLPFVVDSPAGSIDLDVRPKIGELIPKLTSQFIAFIISSERESFVQPLKNASNSDVQFITLFRKGREVLEHAARQAGDYSETTDGICVRGESFFNDFQLNQEEAL